jgi:hypothetical protein
MSTCTQKVYVRAVCQLVEYYHLNWSTESAGGSAMPSASI